MRVEIDRRSGFCFGVINAIKEAENELEISKRLYCLGDIVHNGKEVERLEKMGLESISKEKFFTLKDCKVLIRAHGEPPETYEYAKANNIELIDATCPVVITLQEKVKQSYDTSSSTFPTVKDSGFIGTKLPHGRPAISLPLGRQ